MAGRTEDVLVKRRPLRTSVRAPVKPEYVAGVARSESPFTGTGIGNRLLYAAATDLLRAADESAVLSAAVRYAAQLLSTHIAFVMLLDQGAKILKLEASVGHRTPTFTTIVRPVQAITAVGPRKPMQSSDFLNGSRLDHHPSTDDILRKQGIRTVPPAALHPRHRIR